MGHPRKRPRNDLGQYDDLADEWWRPHGAFAMLHWIAKARSLLVPPAPGKGAVLLDLACGAGLLAPHIEYKGYHHVGVDITTTALQQAGDHKVTPVRGDVLQLPFCDESFDVVTAGEILEHVSDLEGVVDESCRVLRPGGLIIIDTIADTRLAKLLAVTIAERIHGGAPPGIHDPALFVNRDRLKTAYARNGVKLEMKGLRPSIAKTIAWRLGKCSASAMVPTRSTAVVFQAWGRKVG